MELLLEGLRNGTSAGMQERCHSPRGAGICPILAGRKRVAEVLAIAPIPHFKQHPPSVSLPNEKPMRTSKQTGALEPYVTTVKAGS